MDRFILAISTALALAVGLRAALAPLADPDLPLHLAIGEWIVAHRAVPFEEPLAWTRAGEPYYAYSWIWQVTFYILLAAFGPAGLHLLAGAAGAAVVVAGIAFGRAMGIHGLGAILLGGASGLIAVESTPFLRPQLLMHAIVLLAWVAVAAWSERGRARDLLLLLILAALATNSHITAPVLFAPLALLLARPQVSMRRLVLAGGAVVVGLLITPYLGVWLDVYLLNFRPNVMLTGVGRIGELRPGFETRPILGLALASLPLFALPAVRREREILLYGLLWLAGLIVFARAGKGLGPWWWCALPLAALALGRVPRPRSPRMERTMMVLVVVAVASTAIENARLLGAMRGYESGVADRRLPSIKGYAAEEVARHLEAQLRADARGRLLTAFDYGSYLAWRLPTLSQSVDSRTIFPDSAALPDLASLGGELALGPWRSADLAVVPLDFPVAAVLDTAPGWRRLGTAAPAPWAPTVATLGYWVREQWWRESRR